MTPPSPATAPSTAGLRVLIVDPWPQEWDETMPLLTKVGMVISLVATGQDAIHAARTQQPHLALVEVSLSAQDPHMTAIHLVSRLRQLHPTLTIALVSSVAAGEFWLNYERFPVLLKRVPDDLVTAIGQTRAEGATA